MIFLVISWFFSDYSCDFVIFVWWFCDFCDFKEGNMCEKKSVICPSELEMPILVNRPPYIIGWAPTVRESRSKKKSGMFCSVFSIWWPGFKLFKNGEKFFLHLHWNLRSKLRHCKNAVESGDVEIYRFEMNGDLKIEVFENAEVAWRRRRSCILSWSLLSFWNNVNGQHYQWREQDKRKFCIDISWRKSKDRTWEN